MANGQQLGRENEDKVEKWINARDSAGDYLDYEHQGKIKRASLIEELGFCRSVVTQNSAVNKLLTDAEQRWYGRKREGDGKSLKTASERSERKSDLTAAENSRLMDEMARVKAENALLKTKLRRYAAMADVLAETGIAPR